MDLESVCPECQGVTLQSNTTPQYLFLPTRYVCVLYMSISQSTYLKHVLDVSRCISARR